LKIIFLDKEIRIYRLSKLIYIMLLKICQLDCPHQA
jgi:hypothetical protein